MRRLTAALPLAAVALVFAASPVLAQEASVTVTNLICPGDYSGSDHAADCTEVPDPPLPFEISGPVTMSGETDGSGMVTFTGLEAGEYTLTGGAPGDFADAVVECTAEQGEVSVSQDGVIVMLEISADAQVSCSWWNIPQDGGAPPNTAMTAATGAGAATLAIAGIALLALGAGLVAVRARGIVR